MVIAGTGLLVSACGPATVGQTGSPTATPTPNTLDLSLWTVSTVGTGPTASAANSGVDLFIPGNAQQDPQRPLMAVNVQGKCKLTGDFDMQLDYALTTWPARNGVRLGLAAGTSSVQRNSNPANADNRYVTDFNGPTTVVETQDMTGRLRLSRAGAVITGYYLSKGRWVAIASTNGSTDPLPYGIAAWTDPAIFGKADVRVNVKHFVGAPTTSGCP